MGFKLMLFQVDINEKFHLFLADPVTKMNHSEPSWDTGQYQPLSQVDPPGPHATFDFPISIA
ncbi:hypothetical protein ACTXT7_010062 [Hymenolepis weldensis]